MSIVTALLSWMTVPEWANTAIIAGCIAIALAVLVAITFRTGATLPGVDRGGDGSLFDPLLCVSALTVIGLASIAYLAR